jgi:hypothetical protein
LPLKQCHVFDTHFRPTLCRITRIVLLDDAYRAPSIRQAPLSTSPTVSSIYSKRWIAAFDYMTADAALGPLHLINAS